MRLHHVQLACPVGGEDAARRFWVDGLGLREVEKPAELVGRGGAWFRAHDATGRVTVEIHVGVEEAFAPARKAHPALYVGQVADLELVAVRLRRRGHAVDDSQRHTFPGYQRLHTVDGHGNRVELLADRVGPAGAGTCETPDSVSETTPRAERGGLVPRGRPGHGSGD